MRLLKLLDLSFMNCYTINIVVDLDLFDYKFYSRDIIKLFKITRIAFPKNIKIFRLSIYKGPLSIDVDIIKDIFTLEDNDHYLTIENGERKEYVELNPQLYNDEGTRIQYNRKQLKKFRKMYL